MDMFSIMEKVGTLFALIIIGLVFGKLARTTEKDTQLLAKVVLNVVVPANIIASVRMEDFDSIKQDLFSTGHYFMLCAGGHAALAFLFTRLLKMEGATAAVYRSAVFSTITDSWAGLSALLFSARRAFCMLCSIPSR